MRWLEVDAKRALARHGISVPASGEARTGADAVEVARQLGAPVMVKALVPVAERARLGGVRRAGSPGEAGAYANAMLAAAFDGVRAESVLIEQAVEATDELYMAWLLERRAGIYVALFTAQGGSGLEARFAEGELLRWEPGRELRKYHLLQALDSRLSGNLVVAVANMLYDLYTMFRGTDATLLEVNPVLVTPDARLVAADCHLITDDNAAFRHVDAPQPMRQDPLDQQFAAAGFNYVDLGGNVGIIANGAGLTMATVDLVAGCGARPANFLEVGGAAYSRAEEATTLLLQRRDLRVLFLNLFGAFARVDVISDGVMRALATVGKHPPVVAHVHGTGEEAARNLLAGRPDVLLCHDMAHALDVVASYGRGERQDG